MALINCPHCKKPVSDTTQQCIHCGASLSEQIDLPDIQQINGQTMGPSAKPDKNQASRARTPNATHNLQTVMYNFKKESKIYKVTSILITIGVVLFGLMVLFLCCTSYLVPAYVADYAENHPEMNQFDMDLGVFPEIQEVFESGNPGRIVSFVFSLLPYGSFPLFLIILVNVAFTVFGGIYCNKLKNTILFLGIKDKAYDHHKTIALLKKDLEKETMKLPIEEDVVVYDMAWRVVLYHDQKKTLWLSIAELVLRAAFTLFALTLTIQLLLTLPESFGGTLGFSQFIVEIFKAVIQLMVATVVLIVATAIISAIYKNKRISFMRSHL